MAVKFNTPTTDTFNITQKHGIEGSVYYINTYYNSRSGWYVNLYDSKKTPLSLGEKLMPNGFIFQRLGIFTGTFVCLDTTFSREDQVVGRDNFGSGRRYQLHYFSSSDIAAIEAGTF